MAAALPCSSSVSMQSSRRSKATRSRPNLTRICQKTKMCSFYERGMCQRGESCSFAHDPNEIQFKPDLTCTKLCPALLSEGHCPRMHLCKFAHSEAELRVISVDEAEVSLESTLAVASASPGASVPEVTVCSPCLEDVDSASMVASKQVPPTAPQVVARLKDAIASEALTVCGMVFHLTRIFLAVYEARPEVAKRVGMPADALAAATVEQTWADAGLDRGSPLSFQDFARLCALPSELMPQGVAPLEAASQPHVQIIKGSARSDASTDESDAWSQCSTDDGSSDITSSTPTGRQTPASCEDLEDVWCEPEVKVLNTFIHISTPSSANRARRAHSVPRHFGRQA